MLQQQMVQNTFSGIQQGMEQMQQDPRAMEELREMVHDLNQMLRDREEGKEPRFNEFMQKHGHYFPPGIENLDQLMEHLQQQMQRMENMLKLDVAAAARPACRALCSPSCATPGLQMRWPSWRHTWARCRAWAASTASPATPTTASAWPRRCR